MPTGASNTVVHVTSWRSGRGPSWSPAAALTATPVAATAAVTAKAFRNVPSSLWVGASGST